eukprot:scaffold199050_cov25-Prasinocladus_malaysianus.AAC.1
MSALPGQSYHRPAAPLGRVRAGEGRHTRTITVPGMNRSQAVRQLRVRPLRAVVEAPDEVVSSSRAEIDQATREGGLEARYLIRQVGLPPPSIS